MGYELDGAFSEYVRMPARALAAGNVSSLPDHVGFEQAALIEPLACVVNGQEQISIRADDAVLVFGAGPIGLLHVKLACLAGVRRVIVSEPAAARRQAAPSTTATRSIGSSRSMRLSRAMDRTIWPDRETLPPTRPVRPPSGTMEIAC